MGSKVNAKESSFCFICTRETAIADCVSRFIPVKKMDAGDDQAVWKNEWLTTVILRGRCCVFVSIESPPAKVSERSNTDLDGKESARGLRFGTSKSPKNKTVEFNAGFCLIATCTCTHQEVLSCGLLELIKIVHCDDQVGCFRRSRKWMLMPRVFDSKTDAGFRWNVPKDDKSLLFSGLPDRLEVVWLTKLSRRAAILGLESEGLAETEAVYFIHHFPGADFRFGG
jgi:hypothetical protein